MTVKKILKSLGKLIAFPIGLTLVGVSLCLIPIKLLDAVLTGTTKEVLAKYAFAFKSLKFGIKSFWEEKNCYFEQSTIIGNDIGDKSTFYTKRYFIIK